jgi:hypothetical protein
MHFCISDDFVAIYCVLFVEETGWTEEGKEIEQFIMTVCVAGLENSFVQNFVGVIVKCNSCKSLTVDPFQLHLNLAQ